MSERKDVYNSFAEVAVALGYKPVNMVTENKEKLKAQREQFLEKHKCRACGEQMVWIPGTSIMSCKNPKCKGQKIKKKDEDGKKIVIKKPSYYVLDKVGTEIAANLFKEEE